MCIQMDTLKKDRIMFQDSPDKSGGILERHPVFFEVISIHIESWLWNHCLWIMLKWTVLLSVYIVVIQGMTTFSIRLNKNMFLIVNLSIVSIEWNSNIEFELRKVTLNHHPDSILQLVKTSFRKEVWRWL